MPLRPFDDDRTIDLRAPASAPGPGGFTTGHPPSPLGLSVQYAQAKGPLPIGAAATNTVATPVLGLFALLKDAEEMKVFFKGKWNVTPKPLSSWQEFAEIVRNSSPVGTLIVYSHGEGGQLKIGGIDYGLEQTKVRQFFLSTCAFRPGSLAKCGAETVPGSAFCSRHRPRTPEKWIGAKADNLQFEGCTVGQRPGSLAVFGKVLDARTVSGFTWFHLSKPQQLNVPKGTTVAELEKLIAGFKKYLVEGQATPMELANRAHGAAYTTTLWIEYFLEGSASGKDKDGVPPGAKARSEVPDRMVSASKAKELDDEFEAEMKMPCVRVIVKLD